MKRRAYLVDDEALALRRLARLLTATGRIEIVGQATDPEDALSHIPTLRVEVVFLDISMPGLDGFAVAQRLPASAMIVFTTAHDEHALRAFQVNAIDYLLKPVREEELARALDKLDRLRTASDADAQLAAAMARITAAAAAVATAAPGAGTPERLASRLGDKIQLVEVARISHFQAEDKLTHAVVGERSYVVDATIAELEERYASAGFIRIHRGTLVRISAIAELHTTTDGTRVRLGDGRTELHVSRERLRALKDRLGVA